MISIPHAGTYAPDNLLARWSGAARPLPDTDWHVDKLYDFAPELGASVLKANYSRYVIDLNRPPDGGALYPGQTETGLVPVRTFDGEAIYSAGDEPDAGEIARRVEQYWRPYHARLKELLNEVRAAHGFVLLWEAHSIRSEVPLFFSGRLPDLNFGTNDGKSAPEGLLTAISENLTKQSTYSCVFNQRFKGGYTTRHYGRPLEGVLAVQLEIAQRTYMDELPPFSYDSDRAELLKPVIRRCLDVALTGWKR